MCTRAHTGSGLRKVLVLISCVCSQQLGPDFPGAEMGVGWVPVTVMCKKAKFGGEDLSQGAKSNRWLFFYSL